MQFQFSPSSELFGVHVNHSMRRMRYAPSEKDFARYFFVYDTRIPRESEEQNLFNLAAVNRRGDGHTELAFSGLTTIVHLLTLDAERELIADYAKENPKAKPGSITEGELFRTEA
tara:strand:+ start:20900 stop:21244 length:345 start_codon:yes stop_codon:yes gene_type:complete